MKDIKYPEIIKKKLKSFIYGSKMEQKNIVQFEKNLDDISKYI